MRIERDTNEKPAGLSIGDRFSKEFIFSAESIRQFAEYVGDTNPLHHSPAAASVFGEIIASGAHTFSIMIAMVPDYLNRHGRNVGLEASVQMRRPVRAGDRTHIEWRITDIEQNAKLRGWIVVLSGRLSTPDGIVAVTAISKSLLYRP